MTSEIIRFGNFALDRVAYQLRYKGAVVPVEPLPLRLLLLLVEKPGQLLTRNEIYQRIWGKTVFVDPENAINTAIRKVRRALNDDARKPQLVIRVSGKGYRFAGRLQGPNRRPTLITSSSKLVGRERQMAELRAALGDTMSGQGRFTLVSGEPGIGKSRICLEIAADAEKKGMAVMIGHCIEQEAMAYLPFAEILDAYVDRAQNPDELRRMMGEDGPELGRLLPKLQRILPELPPPLELGVEQARRHLFNCFGEFMARRCREQSTLIILEDLQSADDSTLALISHISQRYPSLPLMMVGTYRASRADLNPSLTRALESLVRARRASEMRLKGLDRGEVASMLQALSGQTAPAEMAREFHARTDGNPFFVEELFRHLEEEDRLYDAAGQLRVEMTAGDTDVPPKVGLVVGRRLGRLREATNHILSVAAVIGRSFSCKLLEAASGIPGELLLDHLDEAEQVGLIRSTSASGEARTEFSHELTRGAILSRLSATRRQRLHLQVAAAIERIYSDSLEDHYAALAQHYAADTPKAARYFYLAGQQAMQRSAHTQAVRLLTSSLDLLKGLRATEERDRQELASSVALGASLSANKGLAAPEVEQTYSRAVQLARALGDPQNLFLAQCCLAVSYFMRARMQTAQEVAKQLVDMAQQTGDPTQLFLAHGLMGQSSFWLGELTLGHWHLEQAIARHGPQVDRAATAIFGYHPIVPLLAYTAQALWCMGYPLRALDKMHSAETLARQFGQPYTLLMALHSAAWFHIFRREAPIVLERSEAAIALAKQHGSPYLAAQSSIMRGWALVHLGREVDGIAELEAGLAARKATGADYPPAQFLGWLAEAYGKTGQATTGFTVLEEALATVHRAGDPAFEAELHRLKGELLLIQDPLNSAEAAHCFQIAIEKSVRQGAKPLELRAKMSLARQLGKCRRTEEALALLSEIYRWFTEGFDTLDLKDAEALLNELSP